MKKFEHRKNLSEAELYAERRHDYLRYVNFLILASDRLSADEKHKHLVIEMKNMEAFLLEEFDLLFNGKEY